MSCHNRNQTICAAHDGGNGIGRDEMETEESIAVDFVEHELVPLEAEINVIASKTNEVPSRMPVARVAP